MARRQALREDVLEGICGPLPKKTPLRWEQAMREMCDGCRRDPFEVFEGAIYPAEDDWEVVTIADIPFVSLCEHHLSPFTGTVTITYHPGASIAGLSKFARAVEILARRPQLQERLTAQIADVIHQALKPRSVEVQVEGAHSCMTHRGARAHGARTITRAIRRTA